MAATEPDSGAGVEAPPPVSSLPLPASTEIGDEVVLDPKFIAFIAEMKAQTVKDLAYNASPAGRARDRYYACRRAVLSMREALAAVAMLVVALALVVHYGVPRDPSSADTRGGPTGQAYGINISIKNLLPPSPHPGAPKRHPNAVVSLVFCHHVGDPAAHAWHADQRFKTREDSVLTPDNLVWRTPRCFVAPRQQHPNAYHTVDATFAHYLDVDPMPARLSDAQIAAIGALRPRVAHAFVDTRGELFYRVVMWQARAFRPVLVRHRELVDALEALSTRVNERFETARDHRRLCVCPEHLGIVGSGLSFTPEVDDCEHAHDKGVRWRILSNMAVGGGKTEKREHLVQSHVPMTTHVSRFPAAADHRLLTNETQRLLRHPESIWFRALDAAVFLDAKLVERYDRGMRYMWDRPAIAADAATSTHLAAPVPRIVEYMSAIPLADARADAGGTCRYRDVPPSLALRCFYHCARLGEALRGRSLREAGGD